MRFLDSCIATAMVLASGGLAHAASDMSGVWLSQGAKPLSEARPPLNAAGRAAYAKVTADLKSGATVDAVKKYCLPEGVPRLMSSPYPFKIVQSAKQVTIVHESHHTYRIVLMDNKHPADDDAISSFMGDSIGRWDKDTLVIDTVQFNTAAPLDATGLPHGEKLRVVERLTKSSDGRVLVNKITIEDPEFYSRPWTVTVNYRLRPDVQIEEYACGEPHRDLSKVTMP